MVTFDSSTILTGEYFDIDHVPVLEVAPESERVASVIYSDLFGSLEVPLNVGCESQKSVGNYRPTLETVSFELLALG
jgi:hypothetical protein